MRAPLPLILIFALLPLTARSQSRDVVHDNGGSSRQDGWEMTQWFEADDFVLTDRTQLSGIRFWNYVFPGMFAGTITWELYTNTGSNSPDVLIASGSSSPLTHEATGFALFTTLQEFVTTFDITPVTLEAGTYWIALHNGPRENVTRGMFWAPTASASGAPSHSRESLSNGPWYSNAFPGLPSDLAFQVYGTVVPRAVGSGFVNGAPAVRFTSKAGKYYRLEYKDNLSDASWTTVPGREMIAGTGGEVEVDDPQPDARTRRQRFYRVAVL
jgi:hypothetical protein